MNFVLTRSQRRTDGIFSVLTDEQGNRIGVTVTHSFFGEPVIPNGVYKCVRGIHQLKDGIPFETFEITGIQGHSGLLFHCGNFGEQSEGCELVGESIQYASADEMMIVYSRKTFQKLMELQKGCDQFELTVQG